MTTLVTPRKNPCPECLDSKTECCGRHRSDQPCSWCRAVRVAVDKAPPLTSEQLALVVGIFRSAEASADQPKARYVPVPSLPEMPEMPRLAPVRAPRQPEVDSRVLAGVYFIRSADKVKIGVSMNVPQRIKALRTMSGAEVELLAVAKGTQREEAQLHNRFAHLRTHGEWFRAEPELLDFVASLGCEAS